MSADADLVADRLAALLRAERAALRRGAFGELAAMAAEKEMLVERLAHLRPARARCEALARLARESLRQIEAALAGVRAARSRIEQMHRCAASLETYDPQGRTQAVRTAGAAVERRA